MVQYAGKGLHHNCYYAESQPQRRLRIQGCQGHASCKSRACCDQRVTVATPANPGATLYLATTLRHRCTPQNVGLPVQPYSIVSFLSTSLKAAHATVPPQGPRPNFPRHQAHAPNTKPQLKTLHPPSPYTWHKPTPTSRNVGISQNFQSSYLGRLLAEVVVHQRHLLPMRPAIVAMPVAPQPVRFAWLGHGQAA